MHQYRAYESTYLGIELEASLLSSLAYLGLSSYIQFYLLHTILNPPGVEAICDVSYPSVDLEARIIIWVDLIKVPLQRG